MNRVALISILVAMPLLTAGMLAQNDDRSRNGLASASAITADGAPSAQHFNGQWFNGSDSTPDLFYAGNPFSINAKSTGAHLSRHESSGPSNTFRAQMRTFNNLRAISAPGGLTGSFGYFQPVYQRSTDQKLIESVRSSIEKMHVLRYVTQNQPAQFSFRWKQNSGAANLRAGANVETAANLRDSTTARTHKPPQRVAAYRRDSDSEISCLISEEDANPAPQHQIVVVSTVDLAKLGQFRDIEPLESWSDATSAVIKEVSAKAKNSRPTK
jgi:hypothetical protein